MSFVSRRSAAFRLALVCGATISTLALSGCAQIEGFVGNVIPERSGVHTLEVGDCFNNPVTIAADAETPVDLPRENCTLPHDNEVIYSATMTDASYPGQDTAYLHGLQTCLPEFEKFIGVPFDQAATLAYDAFVPSEASWVLGDREVLCFAYDSAAQTEYSLDGVGAERADAPTSEGEAEVTE